MKIKMLMLSLVTALTALAAHAWEDQGGGFNASGFEDTPVITKPVLRQLKKAYPAFSNLCENPQTMTWVATGFDKNGNGKLELNELTPASGHCESWVTGQQYTEYLPQLCDGLSAKVTPVGIDENINGKVSSDEMHATIAECMVYPKPVLQSASNDTLADKYERQGPKPGRHSY